MDCSQSNNDENIGSQFNNESTEVENTNYLNQNLKCLCLIIVFPNL